MTQKGLILDLDGTLYDADLAYQTALISLGVSPESSEFQSARRQVKMRLGAGHVAARNRVLYFKVLLEETGQFNASQVLSNVTHYEKVLGQNLKEQWERLSRSDLFSWLSQQFKILILTNENTRTQLFKLAHLDPSGKFFHRVITSEEFGVEKPHRLLFEEALKRLQMDAQNCIMVGDDVQADLWPAHSLGMRTVWTREFLPKERSENEILPEGCTVISQLDELKVVLSR
jgi:putative hydrolase of the HAD superfamily